MSIPSILQSSSSELNCGRDNPIKSFIKHFDQQTSISQEHQPISPRSQQQHQQQQQQELITFNQEQSQFYNPKSNLNHQLAFHQTSSLTPSTSSHPTHVIPDWSKAYLESHQTTPSVQPHHEPWRDEFISQSESGFQSKSTKTHLNSIGSYNPLSIHTLNQPRINVFPNHLISPQSFNYHQPRTTNFDQTQDPHPLSINKESWESVFHKLDQSLLETTPSSLTNESKALINSIIPNESHDALALTAGSLIETIQSRQRAEKQTHTDVDQGAKTETINKFEKSSFMNLMKKLRDGEIKVEGDQMIEQTSTSSVKGKAPQIGRSNENRGMGGVWANDYEDRMSSMTSGLSLSGNRLSESSSEQRLEEALVSAKKDLDDRLKEMNEVYETDDEARELRRKMNAFQGDGGFGYESEATVDILPDASFNDPNNVSTRLTSHQQQQEGSNRPSVSIDELLNAASEVDDPRFERMMAETRIPGASELWSEELEDDFELNDISGMFGRPLTIPEIEAERFRRQHTIPSAQQQEWDVLQQDWTEAFDLEPQFRLIDQIESETDYKFRRQRSMRSEMNTTHHHAHHDLEEPIGGGLLESVLEQEAKVLDEPSSGQAWYELGIRQQANEQEKLAIAALKRSLELDPNLSDARLALSISYSNENRKSESLREMERWTVDTMSKINKYSNVINMSGLQQMREEVETEGEEEGESIEARYSNLIETLLSLARLGGREEGCVTVDEDLQIALGVLFNGKEEYEKASDCFGTALSVRPSDPILFNRLGATLANNGKADEAIEYYLRALELLPSYVRARYNLSISLINLGNYIESIEHLLIGLETQVEDQGSSGVTSEVLWQTLEINCSLIQRMDLMESCQIKDLNQFRQTFFSLKQ